MFTYRSKGETIFNGINYILLALLAATMLFPFLNILAVSFSSNGAVTAGRVSVFPVEFHTEAYEKIWQEGTLLKSMWNTVYITVIGTFINIIMTMAAAYPLSKRRLKGRKWILFLIAFTMWFNGGMIPTYLLIKDLKLIDSLWSLMLPGAISVYYMIILKTFYQSVPDSLEESAQLDGANDISIMFRIMLPLSLPTIASLSLFYAVGHWNTFTSALIYINKPDKFPLQVKLQQMITQNRVQGLNGMVVDEGEIPIVEETLKAAAIIFATVPILLIYPFLQKYFVKGVMIGSVKG